ncbi:iron-siderophore ABC transporter substrate-binding protein [Lentibacillus jeotgali]|uniref:iron-siderophore ABC transporter substrate-binding protein n=1 Tax=Lentibacillus jeotgali TaxID=558169 RepID=UPI000262741D|nr:iron-siderophore ABC transporter substrate-binding protein [Lentibacillus jeotgali]
MNRYSRFSKICTVAMATAVIIGLMGCSSDKNENTDETASDSSNVTVDTKFGEVEVPEQPERVVALGWGDAETALALGVEPIGASDWLDFGGNGVGPWLEGAYEESPTIIGTMEPDYEKIAALNPDLILDVKSSGDEQRYERLSDIAPTIGVPEGGDNYLTSMEQQVRMIAKVLHKEEKGEKLLDKVDASFEKAAKENPEFDGKTITVGAYTSEGFGAYVEGDSRIDFATRLGFETKDEIEELADGNFSVSLADEQLQLLNADLTVVFPIGVDKSEITSNELFQQIPSVEDGRSIVLDQELSDAFSTGTVPSTLWAIDNVTPKFAEVLKDEG